MKDDGNLHAKWHAAKTELDKWKKIEHDLRIEICTSLLKGKEYGTHKRDYPGYRLVAKRVANYSLDQPGIAELYQGGELTAEEEDLIKVRYELAVGPYKKATIDTSKIDALITLKDGMPQLEWIFV